MNVNRYMHVRTYLYVYLSIHECIFIHVSVYSILVYAFYQSRKLTTMRIILIPYFKPTFPRTAIPASKIPRQIIAMAKLWAISATENAEVSNVSPALVAVDSKVLRIPDNVSFENAGTVRISTPIINKVSPANCACTKFQFSTDR